MAQLNTTTKRMMEDLAKEMYSEHDMESLDEAYEKAAEFFKMMAQDVRKDTIHLNDFMNQ